MVCDAFAHASVWVNRVEGSDEEGATKGLIDVEKLWWLCDEGDMAPQPLFGGSVIFLLSFPQGGILQGGSRPVGSLGLSRWISDPVRFPALPRQIGGKRDVRETGSAW